MKNLNLIRNNDLSTKCFQTSHLTKDANKEVAIKVLSEVTRFRRIPKGSTSCNSESCSKCHSLYLSNILFAINKNEPVTFVLPAFPGKSPNLEKVLGALPDQAERLSLTFLENLCEKIKKHYSPGAKIVLCSDGRVFSDVVGMKEEDVTAYQVELDLLIEELSLKYVSTFNLDDYYTKLNFTQMRSELMSKHGKSFESLRAKVRRGGKPEPELEEQEANRMYCGITRFLFEDSMFSGQIKSRAAVQKESRANAYEVIRRSNAWSDLIEEYFPEAVRLSIHPQVCGSKKLGIRLVANESWMTPWHGVAVETDSGYVLLKRSEAEERGAKLIYSSNGRASHYKLTDKV